MAVKEKRNSDIFCTRSISHVQFLELVVASYKFEGEDLDYLVAKISDLKRDVASHLDHLKHYIEDKNVPFRSK